MNLLLIWICKETECLIVCELFGFSGHCPVTINEELKTFFSHSDKHPHGWGLALIEGNHAAIEKEPWQADDSHYLKARLRDPIRVKTALAHIRLATIGKMEWKNCHPYTAVDHSGRRWVLIHNGTIFEYAPMNPYVARQNGDTDSERILLYLIDQVNDRSEQLGHPLTAEERFALLDELVAKMAPGNKLNILLSDGELLYAHTNYRGSLHQRKTQDGVFLATLPLTPSPWEPLPLTTLVAYREGELICTGTCHGAEFFDDEEKMKMLFLAFAEL